MAKDMNAVAFSALRDRYNAVRSRTEALAAAFSAEDSVCSDHAGRLAR
jgi:hypothetical protein